MNDPKKIVGHLPKKLKAIIEKKGGANLTCDQLYDLIDLHSEYRCDKFDDVASYLEAKESRKQEHLYKQDVGDAA